MMRNHFTPVYPRTADGQRKLEVYLLRQTADTFTERGLVSTEKKVIWENSLLILRSTGIWMRHTAVWMVDVWGAQPMLKCCWAGSTPFRAKAHKSRIDK